MLLKFKENLPVIVERHPCYESINKKLMEQVDSLPLKNPYELPYYTNVQAGQYTLTDKDVGPTIKLIQDWIRELIAINVSRNGTDESMFVMWFSKYTDEKGSYHASLTETENNFDVVTTLPFTPNSLLLFPRSNQSFHGVEEINSEGVERNLIQLNYYLKPKLK